MAERIGPQLTESVLESLRGDTFLRRLTMGLQVVADDNGVVTLTGSIDSLFNRDIIEQNVRQVEGVRDVNNYLTLMGADSNVRPDAEVQHEIMEQMALDPTLERRERFHVRVRFGRVELTGEVESWEERESVVAAVQRVPGVQAVEDRLEMRVPLASRQRPGRSS